MPLELKVPAVGESVQEVQIGQWLVAEGDRVRKDQNLVEIETDKASLELPAPADGVLQRIVKRQGEPAEVGEVVGLLDAVGAEVKTSKAEEKSREQEETEGAEEEEQKIEEEGKNEGKVKGKEKKRKKDKKKRRREEEAEKVEQVAGKLEIIREKASEPRPETIEQSRVEPERSLAAPAVTPAARRMLREHGLAAGDVGGSRRITPDEVRAFVERRGEAGPSPPAPSAPDSARPSEATSKQDEPREDRPEDIVPMSLLRKRIARRLVEAQQTAAILTTFNEIDMTAVMDLRREHKEHFQQTYGVKLGIMSFFVKAAVEALKEFPAGNAEIRDDKLIYKKYYDIGVAIGGGKGLVVPVLKNAQDMSFAHIEQAIADFAKRAASGELKPDELAGGTFTISNGGVYGSLLSTPILNPPQSGILGLHSIQDRPVAREGQVVIRPMMYAALSYDHRLIDGREAVSFLRRVKETIEEPARVMLEI